MLRLRLLFFLMLCFGTNAVAQRPVQTLKGIILDKTTKQPLVGATITLPNTNPMRGATADANGRFKIERVAVGRYVVKAQFVGYDDFLTDVELTSAKQAELTIELREKTGNMGNVTVVANRKNEPLNEMSVISTRSFSVGETERYAATINDPSRLVAGFAGVQTNQDNNNDVIVRGNSPVGVLWRLEGVDIPNPNHFARPASSGGGISAFSAALLANSDFSSGAFAAEYGNALSSVFDMKFRHGNTEKAEYRAKIGLIGLELGAEAPFKKGNRQSAGNNGSYLINYRYSTLGLLSKLGFNFVSERTTNDFQDVSFNLYFPKKNKKGEFTVFGFGGTSLEDRRVIKELRGLVVDPSKKYSQSDRRRYHFKTDLAVLGGTHTRLLDSKSFLKTTLALMWNENSVVDDTLNNRKTFDITANHIAKDTRISLASHYSRKVSSDFTLKSGFNASVFQYDVLKDRFGKQGRELWIDDNGTTAQLDIYGQGKWQLKPNLSLLAGIHGLYFALNNTTSIEPRAALQYFPTASQNLTLAYGLHSRILPIGTYLTISNICDLVMAPQCNLPLQRNENLDLAKAHHLVFSYDLGFAERFRFHTETFYQKLFDIPVSTNANSAYWMFNDSEGFGTRDMINEGKGTNKGIDFSLEHFYAKKFFFLATASLYQSRYELPNGLVAPTAYDNGYTTSFMGGKEFTFRKGGTLQFGARFIRNGGNRFTPPNIVESKAKGYFVPDDTRPFAEQVPDYMRLDGRIAYMKNRASYHYTLSLDIFNATNRTNPQNQYFDSNTGKFSYGTQSTFTPVLSWEVDF